MAIFKPYKIQSSQLNSLPISEGQFIVTTDDKSMYVDANNATRIKIYEDDLDNLTFAIVNELPTGSNIDPNTIYLIENGSGGGGGGGGSNLTYTLSKNGDYIVLTASNGTTSQVIDAKGLDPSLKGVSNGLAELDANGKVPTSQLPAFVDDVIEGYYYNGNFYKESSHTTVITGETGKIYIDLSTEKTYRWSGSVYTEISSSLALGETSSTAYRGDRGKIAYDHSQSTHARTDATKTEASSTNGNIKINGTETTVYTHPGSGTNPHGTTATDIGLGNVGNFKAVSTVANQDLSSTEQSNARENIGAGTSNLGLGTTSSTAYRGDYGNTAYTHATDSNRLTTAQDSGLYKIATTAEGHIKTATAVQKSDITALGIPESDTTYNDATTSVHGLMSTADKNKLNVTNLAYATCSTAAATAQKEVTVIGNSNWVLEQGSTLVIKFSATNTAENPTLKVGSYEAKSIYYNAALITTSNLNKAGYKNKIGMYMYDGTNFVWLGWGSEDNSTYSNVSLGQGYAVSSTTSGTALTASLSSYALTANGIVSVKFAMDVPAGATLNINDKGAKAIYNGDSAITAGVIKNGEVATFIYNTYYRLIGINRFIDPSNYYTQSEINTLLGNLTTLDLEVVQTLPTTDISTTTIYLVPKSTGETQNTYDEYVYINNAWEKIGDTKVDLSNYSTTSEVQGMINTAIGAALEASY